MGGASVNGDDGAAEAAAPSLQVIILGSGGGPLEHNTSAFLVRSLQSGWRKGSVVAIDAGVHLSAIAKIFKETLPPDLGKNDKLSLPYTLTTGPFAGFEAPFACPDANAAHMHRNMIDTYLITHPHLDHIAGFVINTAGLPGSRAKRLAGLPSTIAAFKTHIFNNIIWPNLSDENNGAGLVTYMRLVEGGSPAVGSGEGRGYLEITDDLGVKVWGVSHGHCVERHSHRGSSSSTRFGSMDGLGIGTAGTGTPVTLVPPNIPGGSFSGLAPARPVHHGSATPVPSMVLQQQQQRDQQLLANAQGVLAGSSAPSGPGGRHSSISQQPQESICVYDSSAYFIRDMTSGREVLFFGDVEPDSISLSPRNQQIWQEAAPKIASGKLAAIFIESSYDDSQPVDRLFGHLAPRFIIQEMANLAEEVRSARQSLQQESQDPSSSSSAPTDPATEAKKRKRDPEDSTLLTRRKAAQVRTSSISSPLTHNEEPISPRTVLRPSKDYLSLVTNPSDTAHSASALHFDKPGTPRGGPAQDQTPYPLKGLKVVIIHVKDKMTDGPKTGEIILRELKSYEADTKLGCEFLISQAGESMYL